MFLPIISPVCVEGNSYYQYRPGKPIYQRYIYNCFFIKRDKAIDGRKWACHGQCFNKKALEECEICKNISVPFKTWTAFSILTKEYFKYCNEERRDSSIEDKRHKRSIFPIQATLIDWRGGLNGKKFN